MHDWLVFITYLHEHYILEKSKKITCIKYQCVTSLTNCRKSEYGNKWRKQRRKTTSESKSVIKYLNKTDN